MAASKRKDRSPEEVVAEFNGARDGDVVFDPNERVNDDPEPDIDALEGRTVVGTVDDGTPAAPLISSNAPVVEANVLQALVVALQQIASGQVNSQRAATEALDMAARQQQPDNKFAPNISDYNPQGDRQFPRPKLKCEMFLPWEAEAESLTYEEIELLNLLEDGEYMIKRNDGAKVKVVVKLKMNTNGTPDVLMMNSEAAFNDENHWMMPGLTIILRQILESRPHTRTAAQKIYTMDTRVVMVESGELAVSVGSR